MSGCHVPEDKEEICIWCKEEIPCGCALAMVRDLQDRVEKLEELNQQCFDANPIKMIEERFNKIEERMNILMLDQHNLKSLLESLAEEIGSKKPHKCPVCDGRGHSLKHENETVEKICTVSIVFAPCHTCESKGIVWG